MAVFLVLGYRNPLLGDAVVMTAMPILVTVVMLAVQYQVAESEAASTLLIDKVSSLVTIAGIIALPGRDLSAPPLGRWACCL